MLIQTDPGQGFYYAQWITGQYAPEMWSWAAKHRLVRNHERVIHRDVAYFYLSLKALIDLTLSEWEQSPERLAALRWPPCKLTPDEIRRLSRISSEGDGCPRSETWAFTCEAWEPLAETEDAARRRLSAELARQLDEHFDRERHALANLGLDTPPEPASLQDIEWLVKYQVGMKNKNALAAESIVSRPTVQRGIERAACLLVGPDYRSWLRDHDPPGRPKSHPPQPERNE